MDRVTGKSFIVLLSSIDDSVHVEGLRLMAVQVTNIYDKYLTEVVIDAPVLESRPYCQSRALDIDSDEGTTKDRATSVYSMLRRLFPPAGELGKTHHHELWSHFELTMACQEFAIVSLYAFVQTHISV